MNTKNKLTAQIYSILRKENKERAEAIRKRDILLENFKTISDTHYKRFLEECQSEDKSIIYYSTLYDRIKEQAPEYDSKSYLAIALESFTEYLSEANETAYDEFWWMIKDMTIYVDKDTEYVVTQRDQEMIYLLYREISLALINFLTFKIALDDKVDDYEDDEYYDNLTDAAMYTFEEFLDSYKASKRIFARRYTDGDLESWFKSYHINLAINRLNLINGGAPITALEIIKKFVSEGLIVDDIEVEIDDFELSEAEETFDTIVRIVHHRKNVFNVAVDTDELETLFDIAIDAINCCLTNTVLTKRDGAISSTELYEADVERFNNIPVESGDERPVNESDDATNMAEPESETKSE